MTDAPDFRAMRAAMERRRKWVRDLWPPGFPWDGTLEGMIADQTVALDCIDELAAALRRIRDYQGDVYWTSNELARATLQRWGLDRE